MSHNAPNQDILGDAEGLEGIWVAHRAQNLERVARIGEAAASAAQGELGEQLRREAGRAARQLLGAGGSLGHPRVSALSREAEDLLRGEQPLPPAALLRLGELVAELQNEIVETAADADHIESPIPLARTAVLLFASHNVDLTQSLEVEAPRHGVFIESARDIDQLNAALASGRLDGIIVDGAFGDASVDALSLLRQLGERAPGLPVVVLNAEEDLETRVELGRAGAQLILRAGLPPAEILHRAAAMLGQLFLAVGATVVAVDDDPQLLAFLRVLLHEHGLRVTVLDNPSRFLEVVEQVNPDIVLLAADMPGIDGVDLCRVLRMDSSWRNIPVVFLTAHSDASTIERLFAAGGDDYVRKPIRARELVARLEYRLRRAAEPVVAPALQPTAAAGQFESAGHGHYPWRFISALGLLGVTMTMLLLVIFVLLASPVR